MPEAPGLVRIVQPGRTFRSFRQGGVIRHRGEITLDRGIIDFWTRITGQVSPVYTSDRVARELFFRERPVDPMLLFNLALSMTVDGVDGLSAKSDANMGYKEIVFYRPVYAGETFRVVTQVVETKEKPGKGDEPGRGFATFKIALVSAERGVAMSFLRTNRFALEGEAREAAESAVVFPSLPEVPAGNFTSALTPIRRSLDHSLFEGGGAYLFGNLKPGQVIFHMPGVTLSDSEHMMLTWLLANFHRGPVKPGDTLFSATKILDATPVEGRSDIGHVLMRQIVLNNARALEVNEGEGTVTIDVYSRKHGVLAEPPLTIPMEDLLSDRPLVLRQPALVDGVSIKAYVGTRRALVLTGEPA